MNEIIPVKGHFRPVNRPATLKSYTNAMGILSPHEFKRDFAAALPGSDTTLLNFLQAYGQALQQSIHQRGNWYGPGISGTLLTAIDGYEPTIGHSTGINSKILMGHDGSADEARDGNFRISAHQCSSCMAPQEAAKLYECNDLKDPYQIRGGQLMRMAVGLHELGHTLFDASVHDTLDTEQQQQLSRNIKLGSEMHADLFMAITMINQLGPEGVAFIKQFTDGMRGGSNMLLGKRHDTANALATLVELAESDITMITKLDPGQINAAALRMTAAMIPSGYQEDHLYKALTTAKLSPFDYKLAPVERAERRLEWYAEQQKLKEDGKPVDERALQIYDQFYRRGDKALMFEEDWLGNQAVMLDLSPLKSDTSWLPAAEEKAAICRAQPAAQAPKPE